MTKKIIPVLLCFLNLVTYGQDKVTITANMSWLPNDTLVTLYEPYSENPETNTAIIKNHKFTITKDLPKGGSVHYIIMGSAQMSLYNSNVIYLDAGNLVISSGEKPGFEFVKFSGSQFAKDWEYVTNNFSEVSTRYKRVNELELIIKKAMAAGDEDAATAANTEAKAIIAERNKDALEWIRANSNSGVAPFVVMAYLPGRKDSLIKTLGPHAQATRTAKRILIPKFDGDLVKYTPTEGAAATVDSLAVGKDAPAFTTLDRDGKKVSLSDFKGKYVFIDFWASWCGPCKAQNPFLVAANKKFKDKNFVMIGISLDSNREPWIKAIERDKMDWLQLSSLKSWAEPAAQVYGVSFIPNNFLIGSDGKIIARNLYDGELDKVLSELVK